jgi:hypothetical protein
MIATEPCPAEAVFTSAVNWLRSRSRAIKGIPGSNLLSDMPSEKARVTFTGIYRYGRAGPATGAHTGSKGLLYWWATSASSPAAMVLALAKAGLKNTRRRTRILVRSVMPSTVWGFWIGIFRSDDACKFIIVNNLHIFPQSHAIREPRRLHLVFNAVIDYN